MEEKIVTVLNEMAEYLSISQMKKLLKNWVNPSSSQKDKPLLSAIKLLMIFISFLLTIRGRHLRVWRILPLMVKSVFSFKKKERD